MLKVCIFPKRLNGVEFLKVWIAQILWCIWSNRDVNHVKTNFWHFRYHQMGEIIKEIATYPKIHIFSPTLKYIFSHTIYVLRHQYIVTHYPCCQILPCKHAKQILFTISTFGFLLYCACASSKHKLMHLYIWSEMEKWGASLFFKIKVCSPLDPANPLYQTSIVELHNMC